MLTIRRSGSEAFTLIELLCVCAILLLLVGLLLPAIDSARDKSITSACISQQRQISIAWQQYSGENEGVAIGCNWQAQSGQPDESPWVTNALSPYGITMSLWRCPASPPEFWRTSYGAGGVGTYGISFSRFTRGGPSWQDPVRMSEIAYPATTAFLGDKLHAIPPNIYTYHAMGGRAWAGMSTHNMENHPWPLHGPWLMTGIKTKTNIARADGSVRTYDYSEIVARNYVFVDLYGRPPYFLSIFWYEAARQYLWSGVNPIQTATPVRSVGWVTE